MHDRGVERLGWMVAGAFGLTLLAGFIGAAIMSLIARAGAGGDWPPLPYLLQLVMFTLEQAIVSTALSILLALPVALAVNRRSRFFGRGLVIGLMVLPLGLPVLPAVFGILEIWGRSGLVNSLIAAEGRAPVTIYGLPGILLAHVFFNLPLAARLMLRALDNVPGEVWRLGAALDLSRVGLFRLVEWPAIVRVIPGIAGLIFMLCVTSFTIVLTLGGGPGSSTLEVAIYQALKFDFDPPRALALCLLQILMTGVTFAILRRLPEPEPERTGLRLPAFRADGRSVQARIIDVFLIGIFLLFVGSPVVAMVVAGWAPLFSGLLFSPVFGKALITSLSLALAAGLSATILTYVIARAGFSIGAGRPGAVLAWLFRLPDFVLLVPPLVIGSGWFLLMLGTGFADRLAAPVVALINAVMAMPFAARLIRPELQAHLERTSQLSANLGITGLVRFRIIDWPVLRRPVLTAFSFAMALSLGDLGAIALFSTDDFVTLPSLLYARLGSYRSEDAAGLALVLGVLCILLTLPAIRLDSNAPGERP